MCVSCGKEKAEDGYTRCHNCRVIEAKRRRGNKELFQKCEKRRENYLRCKEQGICVRCQKAPAVVGVLCESCAEKNRLAVKESKHNYSYDKKYLYQETAVLPEYKRTLSPKELRESRIANKICTRCGKRYSMPFRHLCYECVTKLYKQNKKRLASKTPAELEELRKKNIAYQKDYARKKREAGICAKCGKRLINHSYSTAYCMECSIEEHKRRAEMWRKVKASRTPEEQAILDANVRRAQTENIEKLKNLPHVEYVFCHYQKKRIPKLSFDTNFRKNFYNIYVTQLQLTDISFEDFEKDPVNIGREIRMKYAEMRGLDTDFIKERLCLE